MLSALSSHWLYLSLGLGITTEADTITTWEVVPTVTLFMLISTTTRVMQVVLGTGTTSSGMASLSQPLELEQLWRSGWCCRDRWVDQLGIYLNNRMIAVPNSAYQLDYDSIRANGSTVIINVNGAPMSADCTSGYLNGHAAENRGQAQLVNSVCTVAFGK